MATYGNVKAYTENLMLRARELNRLQIMQKSFPDSQELKDQIKDLEAQYHAAAALLTPIVNEPLEL